MKFIENLSKEEFDNFVISSDKSHFLHSYAWGQVQKENKKFHPLYVGMKKDGKVVSAALILEKNLFLGYTYFYIPRGFVIDYENKRLLTKFNNYIKELAIKRKAIFIKIDPDVIWSNKNYLDETIEVNNQIIFDNITSLGFKHKGFTKGFTTNQPRYTFRIDFNQNFDDIYEHFSKTTKQRIKKAEDLDVEVKITKEVDDFCKLMAITEGRKNFTSHENNFYKILCDNYYKDKYNIFLGIVNIKKIISKYEKEIKTLKKEVETLGEATSKSSKSKQTQLLKRIEGLENKITKYSSYQKEFGDKIVLNAHFIIEYGDKAWVLYAGNHDILTDTYSNYKVYLEHIKFYYDKGIKIYDQFGTIGDLRKDNPQIGLHEFKKKFGGNYIEFIGEFDLVLNKSLYFLYNSVLPRIRKCKKNIKKIIKHG